MFFITFFLCLAQASLIIDKIETQGITLLSKAELQEALQQKQGQELLQSQIISTEKKIQAIYTLKGYPQAQVKTLLSKKKGTGENILRIVIQEGLPVRIHSIHFHSASPNDGLEHLLPVISLKPNDILDLSALEESKAQLISFFAQLDYIAPQIEKVEIKKEVFSSDLLASQWVRLDFQMHVGDKVSFGFLGNQFFSYPELLKFIKTQRLLNLGTEYINIIADALKEQYKDQGYLNVLITPLVTEAHSAQIISERKVTYVIEERPRALLNEIRFEGSFSSFSEDQLKAIFYQNATSMIKNGYYSKTSATQSAENLIGFLKEQGYLSSAIYSLTPIFLSEPDQHQKIQLIIGIHTGNQTIVTELKTSGITLFDQNQLLTLLDVQIGQPLNLSEFSKNLSHLKQNYAEKGYLDALLVNEGKASVVNYSEENTQASLFLEVKEGPLAILDSIELEGAQNTALYIINRRLAFKVNSVLKESDIKKTETNLRRLGIFSVVQIQVNSNPEDPGHKTIKIYFEEADRGSLTFGPGFRSDLGARFFSQLNYVNLFASNHHFFLGLNLNRRLNSSTFTDKTVFLEGQLTSSYIWNDFLESPFTVKPIIMLGKTKYQSFSAQNFSFEINTERVFFSFPQITTQLGYAFERVMQFHAKDQTDNGFNTFSTFIPRLSLDARDNPLSPRYGLFATIWADLGPQFLLSKDGSDPLSFFRLQFRLDQHLPFRLSKNQDLIFYFSFRSGMERAFTGELPLYKLFALGGVSSLRGFQELSISEPTKQSGSLSYVNYRVQMDIPLVGSLKIAFFADAANLLKDQYSLHLKLYSSVGAGLRYVTPVGPLSLDFGIPMSSPSAVNYQLVSFSVGII